MRKYHILLTTIALTLATLASAQVERDSVKVYFRQGQSQFEPFYEGNARRLTDFMNKAKILQRDTLVTLDRVRVVATASPEGAAEVNERLAYNRAQRIAEYLHQNLSFDQNSFEVYFNDLDWDLFERLVEADHYVPQRWEILSLIRDRDLKRIKVERFQRAWDYMLDNIFPEMRTTLVVFEYKTAEMREAEARAAAEKAQAEAEAERLRQEELRRQEEQQTVRTYTPPPLPDDDEDDFDLDLSEAHPWSWYLKTNFLPWALLDANLGVEFEMGRHLSLSIPVFYTALDWFNVQTKFRLVGTQPELRLWFRDDFSGPFLAAHGTFGYYNVAVPNREFRIQDRDGRTPAYGAGLNIGWKFRLDRKRADRLGLELSFGGGWLHLDYDRFYNVENGRYADSQVKDYFGPDHASVALTYRFGK